MKLTFKLLIGIVVVVLVAAAPFVFDMLDGYQKFSKLCEQEGGARQFIPLEKNVAWQGASSGNMGLLADFPNIALIRAKPLARPGNPYPGGLVDYRYLGGNPRSADSYSIKAPDESIQPVYRIVERSDNPPNTERLVRSVLEIVDARSGAVAFRYTLLTYRFTKPENSFLGMARLANCPEIAFDQSGSSLRKFNISFKE